MSWSVGVRAYLRPDGLRPYAEAGYGIRLENRDPGRPDAWRAPGGRNLDTDGMAGALRLGVLTAGPGRAGVFVDAGVEFIARNPGHYAVVPLRIGAVVP